MVPACALFQALLDATQEMLCSQMLGNDDAAIAISMVEDATKISCGMSVLRRTPGGENRFFLWPLLKNLKFLYKLLKLNHKLLTLLI